jgi:hypothetical protein
MQPEQAGLRPKLAFAHPRLGDRRSPRGLARHHVFHEAGDDREHGPAHADADKLADHGAKIDPASAGQGRKQRLQDLPATQSADRPSDRVAERSEIIVLECSPGAVSANSAGDDLENKIDQCVSHMLESLRC